MRRIPKIDRVLARLGPYPGPEPCWLWPGSLTTSGYGRINPGPWGGTGFVHRITYEAMVGPIPDGLQLDHLCRVPACANPAHLDPCTHRENCRRRYRQSQYEGTTHCINGHAFTPDNTYFRPDGNGKWRVCKVCSRTRSESYRKGKQG